MPRQYVPTIEEMEREIEYIWESVRKDWVVNQRYNSQHPNKKHGCDNLFGESDVQFLIVHYLKLFTDKYPRLQIYTEKSYGEICKGGKSGRIDIIVEKSGEPWFVFEIKVKFSYNGIRRSINQDRLKLINMKYHGADRAYFCYIITSEIWTGKSKDFIRPYKRKPDPTSKDLWNYYREARGSGDGNKGGWNILRIENPLCKKCGVDSLGYEYCPNCGAKIPY